MLPEAKRGVGGAGVASAESGKPPPLNEIGSTLAQRYEVLRELGRGGMGTVYLAQHLGTGREVAVKVLVPGLTANGAADRKSVV